MQHESTSWTCRYDLNYSNKGLTQASAGKEHFQLPTHSACAASGLQSFRNAKPYGRSKAKHLEQVTISLNYQRMPQDLRSQLLVG